MGDLTMETVSKTVTDDAGVRSAFESVLPQVRTFLKLMASGRVWGPAILLPSVTPWLVANEPIGDSTLEASDDDCAMDGFFGHLDPAKLSGPQKKAIITLEINHYLKHRNLSISPEILSAAIEAVYASQK